MTDNNEKSSERIDEIVTELTFVLTRLTNLDEIVASICGALVFELSCVSADDCDWALANLKDRISWIREQAAAQRPARTRPWRLPPDFVESIFEAARELAVKKKKIQ